MQIIFAVHRKYNESFSFYTLSGIKLKDCILKRHKRYKRLLVGHMVTLSVGHNRPYDQPFPSGLINELKRRECVIISRHWKFMFKRIFRVSECADACICTKRAKEKSTKLTKLASCVLGRPKCFRRSKTTYRHPTLQSRVDLMLLYCKYLHFMYKFLLRIII